MKNPLPNLASLFTALLTCLVLATSGCVSPNANPSTSPAQPDTVYVDETGVLHVNGVAIDPQNTAKAARLASKYACLELLKQHPEYTDQVRLSAVSVRALIASKKYSPEDLQAAIDANFEGADAEVVSGFTDAVDVYQTFFGNVVKAKVLDKSPYTVPVLEAIAEGALEAVDLSQTKG